MIAYRCVRVAALTIVFVGVCVYVLGFMAFDWFAFDGLLLSVLVGGLVSGVIYEISSLQVEKGRREIQRNARAALGSFVLSVKPVGEGLADGGDEYLAHVVSGVRSLINLSGIGADVLVKLEKAARDKDVVKAISLLDELYKCCNTQSEGGRS